MPIHLTSNPYAGVNAHANSGMQNKAGNWGRSASYHFEHLLDIRRALNAVLPPGYEAHSEVSLQMWQMSAEDDTSLREGSNQPQPDMDTLEEVDMLVVDPLYDSMDWPDLNMGAVIIYKVEPDSELGRPVTRIELLLPINKPQGFYYSQYRDKRNIALMSGLPLIEIDYLHEQPPVYKKVPSYPNAPKSFAYSIAVSDPRPSVHEGRFIIYGFGVDKPIPRFNIPLDGANQVIGFALGPVYNQTFDSSVTLHRVIDYAEPPERMETYSAADQVRIQARMRVVSGATNESPQSAT